MIKPTHTLLLAMLMSAIVSQPALGAQEDVTGGIGGTGAQESITGGIGGTGIRDMERPELLERPEIFESHESLEDVYEPAGDLGDLMDQDEMPNSDELPDQ